MKLNGPAPKRRGIIHFLPENLAGAVRYHYFGDGIDRHGAINHRHAGRAKMATLSSAPTVS
jgi:hypothetical protein